MIDRNVRSQVPNASGTLKNGNKVAMAADDGFTAVKRTKANKESSSTLTQSLKKNKQAIVGVRNSSSTPTLLKRVKIKSLFVIIGSKLTCTRLKIKFQTYALFTFQLLMKVSPQLTIEEFGPTADCSILWAAKPRSNILL
jgi:hypothetical protein